MLEVHGLKVRYPLLKDEAKTAPYLLNGLSLKLNRGQILWVKGANGSGKTTLLYSLCNVIPQIIEAERSGTILLNGLDHSLTPVNKLIPQMGLVMHNPQWQLFFQTVEQEVIYSLENLGLTETEMKNRLESSLSNFGLEPLRLHNPSTLSYGWQKLVTLAIMNAIQPEILLLDEPLNGLSDENCKVVLSRLADYIKSGKAIIIAEHDERVNMLNPTLMELQIKQVSHA